MKKLLYIGADHAGLVVVLLILLTSIAIYQLPQLRLEITAEGMMVKNDPAREFYTQTLDTFGSDNVTIIYLQDQHLFKPEKLTLIANAVRQLNASIRVHHIDSLFSFRYIREEDGLFYTSPYLKKIPQDYQQALSIRDAALQNPLVKNNLLSADGKSMAINVYFDPEQYYRGFDEDVSAELERILNPLKASFEQVFFVGDPYVRTGISERIRADQQIIVPGAILLLIVTLAVSLRNTRAALIPLLTAGISVIWILALMATLDIPVNVMNSVIPALLIIIGSTEDIHLLAEYISGFRRTANRQKALDFMAGNMGMAVLLTFVTTYIGFLSISLNDLSLLQQFGWLTASGLLMNFVVTILLVPASLKYSPNFSRKSTDRPDDNIFQHLGARVLRFTDKYRITVIMLLLISVLLAACSTMNLRINNNVMDYFADDSELVVNAEILHEKISGIQNFSIVISGTVGTFLQVPYIEELSNIQEYLTETGQFDKSFSFADFLAVVHSGIDNQRPGTVYLPVLNEVVENYMSFLSHDAASTLVSADYSQAKIIVRHNISNSEALNQAVADIQQYADDWLDPALKLQVTGESYLNSRAVDYMAKGQAQSLFLMLAVIFVLMSGLFLNTKAGWIVLSTNLFPIIILFGVMAALGIPLNTGTAMVAVISLGICVDHSMHFMVRYNRLSKTADSQFQALERTVHDEAMPIMATALALALGFAALSISQFPPVARFGQLSALVMLLALVSTFVITPLFLRYVRLLSVWDMLSIDIKNDVIKQSPLFAGMRQWQARKIIAMSEIRHFRPDEAILRQGERMEHLYIPLQGQVEAWRTDKDGSAHMTGLLKPGAVFGAVLPHEEQNSSGDMVAISAVHLMVLKSRDLQNVSHMYPRLAVTLLKNLCAIVGDYLLSEEVKSPHLYDDYSGAYSATVFTELLSYNIDRANRYAEPLTLVVIDVSPTPFSKSAIDQNQQKLIALVIQQHCRKPDIFGLWQDGSYRILLPLTAAAGAKAITRRLSDNLRKIQKISGQSLNINIFYSEHNEGESLHDMIDRVNENRVNTSLSQQSFAAVHAIEANTFATKH